MTLSFNLNVDDWVAFQQYHRGRKSPFYSAVYPSIWLMCFGLATIAVFYYIRFREISTEVWLSGLCILVLLYILYIRKKSLGRIREAGLEIQKKNPEAFGSMSLATDENGMTILSKKAHKSVLWSEMDKFEENKQYFFLYSIKGVVYIIPKRDLGNASEFRTELTNNIEVK